MLKRIFYILLILLVPIISIAQPNLSFSRISIESGMGLFNNLVSSLYQDEKGFIWVGTGNGLQRFDGNKFIDVAINKPGSDRMPHSNLAQILARTDGKLLLGFEAYGEIGLFNPLDYSYHKVVVDLDSSIWPRGEYIMIKGGKREIFLNVTGTAILHYNSVSNKFINDHFFKLPYAPPVSKEGIFYDKEKKQFWFACCSGICIYDEQSKSTWYKKNNPKKLAIFDNPEAQDCPITPYVDKQQRIWLVTWGKQVQQIHCFDKTGNTPLHSDTAGIFVGPMGYCEYRKFMETPSDEMWVYGVNILYNYDKSSNRFHYNINNALGLNRGITCTIVYQMMNDEDGSVWLATDNGLYYSDRNSGNASIVNYTLDETKRQVSITDIMEMPDRSLWFTLWSKGISMLDSNFQEKEVPIYRTPPPENWKSVDKANTRYVWNMCSQKATGKILIGCNGGLLIAYDPATQTSAYSKPPEFRGYTVRQIIEDMKGVIWFGTQSGDLFKKENNTIRLIRNLGSSLEKFFIDKQGWLWVSTSNTGVFAIDTGRSQILQHYTRDTDPNSLYLNGGSDIDQLNDSIIVVAAGALNFLNKKTLKIRLMRYEDGLPSNSAVRVRVDKNGYLWIITNNGLCRYNPANDRFNSYGLKDGVILAGKTTEADFVTSKGNVVFGGGASVLLFRPGVFAASQAPPNVTITDFKLFNENLPVDSLLRLPEVRLGKEQSSFNIYFSSLSYAQKDRLTYYYKMEGIDKEWNVADQSYFKSYSLLPPGHYTFKIYSENIEGQRSKKVTEMHLFIRPPFWATKWFITIAILVLAFIVYAVHTTRISKILAMEKLRSRVARDLHDDMGSTLSTINILSAMAKTKMGVDDVKTSEYLTKISDNSQRMMEAMDDIVWSIKPSNDSLQKITARMREFATNVLEAKDIELQFDVEENVCDVKLNMAARRDFFLVFKEAVNNAAKYSKASKVVINVSCKSKKLIMQVKDNGVGFATSNADSGNGLSNMVKRTESMNGKISIKSAPGQGTEVLMSIPIS